MIIDQATSLESLKPLAEKTFEDFFKAVVDLKRGVISAGAELHADDEQILLESGSAQEDLWGINIYPDFDDEDWIEFDSMINIRPQQGNRTRNVEDQSIQTQIIDLVTKLVTK